MGIIHYLIIGAVILVILVFQIRSCMETRRKTQELDSVFTAVYSITQNQIKAQGSKSDPLPAEQSSFENLPETREELGKRLQGKKLALHNYRTKLYSLQAVPGDYFKKYADIERYEKRIITLGDEIDRLEKKIKEIDQNGK